MKINCTQFTISACLLAALFGGGLLARHYSHSPVATPSNHADPDSIPAAKEVAESTLPREHSGGVRAEPFRPEQEIRQSTLDSAFTSSNSPSNSQDLDQNRDWARNFPFEALAWLQNASDGPQRVAIAEIVCPEVAQTNAAAAVTLAENSLGGATNSIAQNLLENLAQTWASQDRQAASAWAMAKPPGEQRDRLLGRIAFTQSKTNPGEAARLVVEQMSPGAAQDEAAISVMHQWALRDTNAAMAWAQRFPEGGLRDRAIQEVQNIMNQPVEVQPAL